MAATGSSTPASSSASQRFSSITARTLLLSPPRLWAVGTISKSSRSTNLKGRACWRPRSRATSPRCCVACSTLASIRTSSSRLGHMAEPTWSSGGPLFQAVVLNRIGMVRLLLERGADPNARVFTAGSAADKAYGGGNSEMIALIEQYGGWIAAGLAGDLGKTEIARKMLAGEIDPHLDDKCFLGPRRGRAATLLRCQFASRRNRPHGARSYRLAAG